MWILLVEPYRHTLSFRSENREKQKRGCSFAFLMTLGQGEINSFLFEANLRNEYSSASDIVSFMKLTMSDT